MSVGVAQNAVGNRLATLSEPGARGRNFHQGANDPAPNAVQQGYNFAEQFERALAEDPQFLFITGWNEWFAGRFEEFLGVRMPVMFVDTFNQENSRDIEPMKGGHGDNYYYQMVSFIRRFKGVRELPVAGPPRTIPWTISEPGPTSVPNSGTTSVIPRSGIIPVTTTATQYVNHTGRNDFVLLKMAHDESHVFFYAQTKDPLTPSRTRIG